MKLGGAEQKKILAHLLNFVDQVLCLLDVVLSEVLLIGVKRHKDWDASHDILLLYGNLVCSECNISLFLSK